MHGACTPSDLPGKCPPVAPPTRGADLTVRLARDGRDLEAAQKLRFDVFRKELRLGLPVSVATGLDQDIYDGYCDHLLVIDNDGGGVVGTYRSIAFWSLSPRRGATRLHSTENR